MDKIKCWTMYVDDTLCYIKTDSIDYVLKMLRACDTCSNQELLQKELNCIEKAIRINNNCPNWVIKNVLLQVNE